jgi:hypothetical protein
MIQIQVKTVIRLLGKTAKGGNRCYHRAKNPFLIADYISPEYFCDREKKAQVLFVRKKSVHLQKKYNYDH